MPATILVIIQEQDPGCSNFNNVLPTQKTPKLVLGSLL